VSISDSELNALKNLDTPTVANAIELFNVRPRNTGFMRPEVRSIFPEMGVMVGYACTATIQADQPASKTRQLQVSDYWDSILRVPKPRVLVMQDLDNPTGVGSFWGEVQANIHKRLGCVGAVTNGGVRDLDEIERLGFNLYASHVLVSHAHVHLVDFESRVRVGGLVISQGDLIHADRHGVQIVPREIAGRIIKAAGEIRRLEGEFIDFCKSKEFSINELKIRFPKLREAMSRIVTD